jgi:thiol-disulfide isomerase/thioredoxin
MRRLPFPPRLLFLSTALALIAAIATYVVLAPGDDERGPGEDTISLAPGDTVPLADAAYTTFDGDEVPLLATHAGTPLVVNFFSKDCVPCIKEMPALEEVHQELGDEVAFLGLAVADRSEDAERFVERTGVTYDTARDPDGTVIAALGGFNLPTTVLLDPDGNIVEVHRGELTADELRTLVKDHLGVVAS